MYCTEKTCKSFLTVGIALTGNTLLWAIHCVDVHPSDSGTLLWVKHSNSDSSTGAEALVRIVLTLTWEDRKSVSHPLSDCMSWIQQSKPHCSGAGVTCWRPARFHERQCHAASCSARWGPQLQGLLSRGSSFLSLVLTTTSFHLYNCTPLAVCRNPSSSL